ncbi:MAG: DUF1674 domain-containing protein [Alphaproteobacteria bacterium]|nr:DUF1674 domain-containing protein [Alphaproteobacteria bacterium]
MPKKTPEPNQHSKQPRKSEFEPATDKDGHKPAREIGGPKGLEPTRYGDWERKGIVSDF